MHQPPRKNNVSNDALPVSRIISVGTDGKMFVTAERIGATGVKMFRTVGKTDGTAEKMCGIAGKIDSIVEKACGIAGNTDSIAEKACRIAGKIDSIVEKACEIAGKAAETVAGNTEKSNSTGIKAGNRSVLTGNAERKNRIIPESNQVIVQTGSMATLSRGRMAIGADPKDMGVPDYNPKATT